MQDRLLLRFLIAMLFFSIPGVACKKDEGRQSGSHRGEPSLAVSELPTAVTSIQEEVDALRSRIAQIHSKDTSLSEKTAARAACKRMVEDLGARGAAAVPALVTLFEEASDPETKSYALTALSRTRSEEALPLLQKALAEGDPNVRINALTGIRDLTTGKQPPLSRAEAAGIFLHVTRDKDPRMRKEGIWCLLAFYDYPVLPRLEELAKDEDPLVQEAAKDVRRKILAIRDDLRKKGVWKGENPLPQGRFTDGDSRMVSS